MGHNWALIRPDVRLGISGSAGAIASLAELDELRRQLVAAPPRDWSTIAEAAELVGRSTVTIRSWCKRHHIGVFDGGRWNVNREHLRQYYSDRFGASRLPVGLRGKSGS
jgi:hypothetical protein